MRKFIIILCILSFNIFANQINKKKNDVNVKKETKTFKYNFRKTTWGMSSQTVKLKEKGKPVYKTPEILGYDKKTVVDLKTFILYIFSNNKLVRGKYVISEKHSNKNSYISDFENIKEKLTKKYGKYKENKIFWLNNLYKDKYQDWGMAIAVGHLSYYTIWETKDTTVALVLSGENYKINLQIEYASKNLKELESKEKEKKIMEDL